VRTAARWQQNRQVVAPPGAFIVDVARRRGGRQALIRDVRALAAGSPVVLSSPAPFARRRCRRFASAAGIDVHREYVALPTPGAPAYLVEDAPVATSHFVRSILVPPPGTIGTAPFRLCLAVVARLANPGRVASVVAPRLVVGARR
jgi:hypothetical protein